MKKAETKERTCQVCFIKPTIQCDHNEVLKCKGCSRAAHRYCYDPSNKTNLFLCDQCSNKSWGKHCHFCENEGLLKKTMQGKYGHIICLLFSPFVYVKSYYNLTFSSYLKAQEDKKGPTHQCSLCSKNTANAIKCAYKECNAYMHLYCSFKNLVKSIDNGAQLKIFIQIAEKPIYQNYINNQINRYIKYKNPNLSDFLKLPSKIFKDNPGKNESIIRLRIGCYKHATCFYQCCQNLEDVNWILCDQCYKWYHITCIEEDDAQIDQDQPFICLHCREWRKKITHQMGVVMNSYPRLQIYDFVYLQLFFELKQYKLPDPQHKLLFRMPIVPSEVYLNKCYKYQAILSKMKTKIGQKNPLEKKKKGSKKNDDAGNMLDQRTRKLFVTINCFNQRNLAEVKQLNPNTLSSHKCEQIWIAYCQQIASYSYNISHDITKIAVKQEQEQSVDVKDESIDSKQKEISQSISAISTDINIISKGQNLHEATKSFIQLMKKFPFFKDQLKKTDEKFQLLQVFTYYSNTLQIEDHLNLLYKINILQQAQTLKKGQQIDLQSLLLKFHSSASTVKKNLKNKLEKMIKKKFPNYNAEMFVQPEKFLTISIPNNLPITVDLKNYQINIALPQPITKNVQAISPTIAQVQAKIMIYKEMLLQQQKKNTKKAAKEDNKLVIKQIADNLNNLNEAINLFVNNMKKRIMLKETQNVWKTFKEIKINEKNLNEFCKFFSKNRQLFKLAILPQQIVKDLRAKAEQFINFISLRSKLFENNCQYEAARDLIKIFEFKISTILPIIDKIEEYEMAFFTIKPNFDNPSDIEYFEEVLKQAQAFYEKNKFQFRYSKLKIVKLWIDLYKFCLDQFPLVELFKQNFKDIQIDNLLKYKKKKVCPFKVKQTYLILIKTQFPASNFLENIKKMYQRACKLLNKKNYFFEIVKRVDDTQIIPLIRKLTIQETKQFVKQVNEDIFDFDVQILQIELELEYFEKMQEKISKALLQQNKDQLFNLINKSDEYPFIRQQQSEIDEFLARSNQQQTHNNNHDGTTKIIRSNTSKKTRRKKSEKKDTSIVLDEVTLRKNLSVIGLVGSNKAEIMMDIFVRNPRKIFIEQVLILKQFIWSIQDYQQKDMHLQKLQSQLNKYEQLMEQSQHLIQKYKNEIPLDQQQLEELNKIKFIYESQLIRSRDLQQILFEKQCYDKIVTFQPLEKGTNSQWKTQILMNELSDSFITSKLQEKKDKITYKLHFKKCL